MNQEVKVTSVLAAYACLVGGCYLVGFWAPFRINIFQFAGILDLVKVAIFPLFLAGAGYLFGSGAPHLTGFGESLARRMSTEQPSNPPSIIGTLYRHRALIRSLWVSAIFLTLLIDLSPFKWSLIALLGMPTGLAIPDSDNLQRAFPNPKLRQFLIMTFAGLPFVSLGAGTAEAYTITIGRGNYVVSPKSVAMDDKAGPIDYLGLIGTSYFFYVRDKKSIVVMKQNDSTILQLLPNPALKK